MYPNETTEGTRAYLGEFYATRKQCTDDGDAWKQRALIYLARAHIVGLFEPRYLCADMTVFLSPQR